MDTANSHSILLEDKAHTSTFPVPILTQQTLKPAPLHYRTS